MDSLLSSLGNLLSVFKDPVNVILLFVSAGEAYFIYVLRREGRDDREKMLETFGKVADALEDIRNFLSASSGKVFHE